jgi:hypothetical protein
LAYPHNNNKENPVVEYNLVDDDTSDADDAEVFGGTVTAENTSVLQSLEAELKRVIKSEPIILNIPSRPNMSVRYDTTIEAGVLQMWRKQSQNKSMTDGFDGLKFSCIVLANKAEGVLYDGVEATLDDGRPLNFKEPRFLSMLGAIKAVEAVRKLYAIDGHIFVAADEILRAAGYDTEGQDQQMDPTLIS